MLVSFAFKGIDRTTCKLACACQIAEILSHSTGVADLIRFGVEDFAHGVLKREALRLCNEVEINTDIPNFS